MHKYILQAKQRKRLTNMKYLPANAISGRSGAGNEDEIFAAAKNSNLFLKIC